MRQPQGVIWRGMTAADEVTGDATPPAVAVLLQQADFWPVAVGVTPYAGCGHISGDAVSGRPATRYLTLSLAPGAERLRYWVTKAASDYSGAATNIEAATATGGLTGNDVAKIFYVGGSAAVLPHTIANENTVLSGDWDYTAPAVQADRLLEVAPGAAVDVESAFIKNCQAFSFVVSHQTQDLEAM